MKAVLVDSDLVTAYGRGVDCCWKGLLSGHSAISTVRRFDTRTHASSVAGIVPGLDHTRSESLCMQMLTPILREASPRIPSDSPLILASSAGELDLLERSVLRDDTPRDESCLRRLLFRIQTVLQNDSEGLVVSAACASSATAVALASAMIREERADSVIVASCDSVTEFVFAGFSSLMALSDNPAAPFDQERNGLSLGEAASYVLLMSEERAIREGKTCTGEVVGWGLSNDANHMTAPSTDGRGLASAILHALDSGCVRREEIHSICAHGTGTPYNDEMEMKAFRRVFEGKRIPTYSIKGAIGHTMGASGLVEMIVALRSLREGIVPPSIGCRHPDACARGWVTLRPRPLDPPSLVLSTSSGFGGINAALILGPYTTDPAPRGRGRS